MEEEYCFGYERAFEEWRGVFGEGVWKKRICFSFSLICWRRG